MKKLFLLAVIAFMTFAAYAQQYIPFPMNNALWTYRIVGSMNPPYEWTHIDSLGGIITIDTIQYASVYEEDYLKGGIREDSAEKKIYFNDYSQEIVLYDFSLSIGDTIFYPTPLDNYKVVTDIDSILVAGQYRKRFQLINALYSMPDTWIEGIGSVYRYGLLNPYYPWIVLDGSTPYFGCFTHDSVVYIDGTTCYGACPCSYWLVDIDESVQMNNGDITIFMDASNNSLQIDMSNADIIYQYIDLLDSRGKLISRQPAELENIEVDVSGLPEGIYLLNIVGSNGSITHRFYNGN